MVAQRHERVPIPQPGNVTFCGSGILRGGADPELARETLPTTVCVYESEAKGVLRQMHREQKPWETEAEIEAMMWPEAQGRLRLGEAEGAA